MPATTMQKLSGQFVVTMMFAFGLASLNACTQPAEDMLVAKTLDFVAAFNAGDPAAMVTMVSDDVRWLTVESESISVEVQGREALKAAMTDYFAAGPRSPSQMRFIQSDGDYVFGVEEIMSGPTGEGRNQCSVVVYLFSGSLIQNVWYHPAYQC